MEKSPLESTLLPIFILLAFVSFVALTVGFFLPYWISTQDVYYGLWYVKRCINSSCETEWYTDIFNIDTRLEIVRIFETLAVIFGMISLVFGVLMCVICHKSPAIRSVTHGAFFATSFCAGLMALIGILILIATVDTSVLQWGVVLPVIASLLFMFIGIFTLVVCRYDPNYDPRTNINMEHCGTS